MPKRAVAAAAAGGGGGGAAKPIRKKKANGYKFPEHIPSGHVITDTRKQSWKILETIGTGGFGEIYSACEVTESSSSKSKNPPANYAVKVEPKENGPLFVEMHFYMRICKAEDIQAWKQKKNLKNFGIPVLHGSGSFIFKSDSYRFLVTDRFSKNLEDILNENGKQFPPATVLQIGVQVLNMLEYIHDKGWIHGDVKAANLLLGMKPGTENTIHLIDFGIACRCQITDSEFKKDPKKAHNGTLEFVSRDGHSGVFGFRGDLEVLGFNLIRWMNGSLPWGLNLTDPVVVENKKIELMNNPKKYITKHLPKVTDELIKYLEYVASLKNNAIPNYDFCRNLFMKKLTISPYGKLVFDNKNEKKPVSPETTVKSRGRKKAAVTKDTATSPVIFPDTPPEIKSRKRKSPVLPTNKSSKSDLDTEDSSSSRNKRMRNRKVNDVLPVSSSNGGHVDSEDDLENDVEEDKKTPSKSKQTKNKRNFVKSQDVKLEENKNHNSSIESSINEDTEDDNDVDAKQTKEKPVKKTRTPNKTSWRDAPAVKASNVKVAGQYSRTNAKKKK